MKLQATTVGIDPRLDPGSCKTTFGTTRQVPPVPFLLIESRFYWYTVRTSTRKEQPKQVPVCKVLYVSDVLGNRTFLEAELDVPGRVSQARDGRSRFGLAKGGKKMSGKVHGLHEILSPPML